jgi:nickel transport protein
VGKNVPRRRVPFLVPLKFLKRAAVFAGLVGLILTAGQPTHAHGTGYRRSDKKPLSLEFSYSTGETMSYLETKVFSPQDEKFAFQSGRTDEDGRFAFTPNAPGLWRVVVRDEEGHLAEAKVDVPEEFLAGAAGGETAAAAAGPPTGIRLLLNALLGVSLIFNVAAFPFAFLSRKRRALAQHPGEKEAA